MVRGLVEEITSFSAPYEAGLHPLGVKNLWGSIDAECHQDAESETRTSRVGKPDGGRVHEDTKHAHVESG